MECKEICRREVVVADKKDNLFAVAKLMHQHDVGTVVVVDNIERDRIPLGILTDRDIALKVVAQELDPSKVAAADVMCGELLVAQENDDLSTTVEQMIHKGVRRVPVVDHLGRLKGILSASDLMQTCGEEILGLAKIRTSNSMHPGH